MSPPDSIPLAFHRTDLDQRIWADELDDFVPEEVFDAHTHIFRWAFNQNADRESSPMRSFVRPEFEHAGWQLLDACDQALMPGRRVQRLSFPFPFAGQCDFDGSNQFVAQEVAPHPASGALMLVHPSLTAEEVESAVMQRHFLGLKPYRFYSATGDAVHCRITDFLPEHQLAVANRLGLLVMLHLSRPRGIADLQNLDDLEYLTMTYPNVRWVLAHCARSYSSWAIESAGERLRRLKRTWFDTSSVCESDAIAALLRCVGSRRVMYGSDDVPVGILRGKYVAFGHAWAFLSETNHSLNLSHCDPRMTFTRYEQLRAMKRAALALDLSDVEIRGVFRDNALQLLQQCRT